MFSRSCCENEVSKDIFSSTMNNKNAKTVSITTVTWKTAFVLPTECSSAVFEKIVQCDLQFIDVVYCSSGALETTSCDILNYLNYRCENDASYCQHFKRKAL